MAPTTRIVARVMQRRPYSLMASLRASARSMELHTPFQRVPVTQKSAPADWGKLVRRVGMQVIGFYPGMALVLGWPFLAKWAFDGRV